MSDNKKINPFDGETPFFRNEEKNEAEENRIVGKAYEDLSEKLSSWNLKESGQEKYLYVSFCNEDSESVKEYLDYLCANHLPFRERTCNGGTFSPDEYEWQKNDDVEGSQAVIVFMSAKALKSEKIRDDIHLAYRAKKKIIVVHLEQVIFDRPISLLLEKSSDLYTHITDERIRMTVFIEMVRSAYGVNLPSPEKESRKEPVRLNAYENDTWDFPEQESSFEGICASGKLISNKMNSSVYVSDDIVGEMKTVLKKFKLGAGPERGRIYRAFEGEVEALRRLNCPFVPLLIDTYESSDSAGIVESYIEGDTLSSKRTYDEDFVTEFAIKAVHILKYLYRAGIVHGDIKPQNFIVNELGDVFLVDFGSSVFTDESPENYIRTGTLRYASPEQKIKNKKIDFRSDIYSLGKTMKALLSENDICDDERTTDSFEDTIQLFDNRVSSKSPDKYEDYNISLHLRRVIDKMTSENRENRYNNLDTLIADLKECRKVAAVFK